MTYRPTVKRVVVAALFMGLAGCRPSEGETTAAEKAPVEKAIAEIQKLGGKVTCDETSPRRPVISVDLVGTQVTDAGLEHLEALTELQTLNLWRSQVTDAALEHLSGLSQLQSLGLGGTKVTDAGLEHLKGLTQLQTLNLAGTRITDAGLAHLKGLSQLQRLGLVRTKVTEAAVRRLKADLPSLGDTPLVRTAK